MEDLVADEDIRVYSDGSAIDGGIGGAAVLMEGDEVVDERRFYLGKTEEHTVYEGEIVGMINGTWRGQPSSDSRNRRLPIETRPLPARPLPRRPPPPAVEERRSKTYHSMVSRPYRNPRQ